ncbi:MAG: hypothetical protein OXG07_01265 [Anaerolineaceae bacterium]|nr:hypothetical protein [Anaerolineaceae bacterium]MCY3906259.1 hypothetical protein [Anaerolineaceae bacterium]
MQRGTPDPRLQRKMAEARAADVRRAVKREQQAESLEQHDVGRRRWLLRLLLLVLVLALVYAWVMFGEALTGRS